MQWKHFYVFTEKVYLENKSNICFLLHWLIRLWQQLVVAPSSDETSPHLPKNQLLSSMDHKIQNKAAFGHAHKADRLVVEILWIVFLRHNQQMNCAASDELLCFLSQKLRKQVKMFPDFPTNQKEIEVSSSGKTLGDIQGWACPSHRLPHQRGRVQVVSSFQV